MPIPPQYQAWQKPAYQHPPWARVIAELEAGFPDLDISSELDKAHRWCVMNPRKRPRKNLARFLLTWFGKQARGIRNQWRERPIPPGAVRLKPDSVVAGRSIGPAGGFIDHRERLWAFLERGPGERLLGPIRGPRQKPLNFPGLSSIGQLRVPTKKPRPGYLPEPGLR